MGLTKIRLMAVLGTRPDAIKLAPVIAALRRADRFDVVVCATAQHREMLDQVLEIFSIDTDHDLDVMRENQSLPDLTARVLQGMSATLHKAQPDLLLVQGDTTTAAAAALAGFYARIPVVHLEAGLRSDDLTSPWPEEMNRRVATLLSTLHLAPTERARARLIQEGILPHAICVTGNTVVDALLQTSAALEQNARLRALAEGRIRSILSGPRTILVTSHRRESWGSGLEHICRAIREVAEERSDVQFIYPVHLNQRVREPVHRLLGESPRIHLLEPLDYVQFVYLLGRCHFVVTDSGGVQEEAPSLGKPVLVVRETTERPEGIEAGVAQLIGTDKDRIAAAIRRLLDDRTHYRSMARRVNPYGDGQASARIVRFVTQWWDRTRGEEAIA